RIRDKALFGRPGQTPMGMQTEGGTDDGTDGQDPVASDGYSLNAFVPDPDQAGQPLPADWARTFDSGTMDIGGASNPTPGPTATGSLTVGLGVRSADGWGSGTSGIPDGGGSGTSGTVAASDALFSDSAWQDQELRQWLGG